jgi:anti-anti-sigma factor
MPKAHVTHAERDGVHVLRYFGRVNYMSAPAIQRFLDHLLEEGKVSGLVFDLTAADALDSTNLGLLARVNERARDAGSPEAMILSKNEDITDVLLSMGFDQSFAIVTDSQAPLTGPPAPIEPETCSEQELRRTMLDAHRALVRLSDAGRLEFQDVVACLESERASSSH